MSNFAFLKAEWPDLHDAASKAKSSAYPDVRTACVYARRTLELAVHWLYKHDSTLKLPYQDHLKVFPLVLPPLPLQREFARRVGQYRGRLLRLNNLEKGPTIQQRLAISQDGMPQCRDRLDLF